MSNPPEPPRGLREPRSPRLAGAHCGGASGAEIADMDDAAGIGSTDLRLQESLTHLRERLLPLWRHLSIPVFVASLVCVVIHVAGNWLDRDAASHAGPEATAGLVMHVEVWSLALAAVIPVVGLEARVWLGAFEPHRSGNLFAAKHRGLEEMSDRLDHDAEMPAAVLSQIARAEHFLENEHREWLRLMLETEWML